MNWILAIPLEWRLAALVVLGTLAGSVVNLAIYRLAWNPREIGPWAKPPAKAPPRRWSDWIPVVGWLGLRREARWLGQGFWIRPLLIELGAGIGTVLLYRWECVALALVPDPFVMPPGGLRLATDNVDLVVHAQFLCHIVLAMLMLAASFIDIDEKIIPDSVTVPGTILGIAAATLYPWCLLTGVTWRDINGRPWLEFLHVASPGPWPTAFAPGAEQWPGLLLTLSCWWLWCFGLMPRRLRARRGWVRGFQLMLARLRRERSTWLIAAMGVVGSAVIALVWLGAPLANRAGMLTALLGMAVAGGLIWAVRVIGTFVLRREAMGFGDVTLMAMIGTLVGWQSSLIVFFLAPFAGLFIGVAQWIVRRDKEIPYGPFLCLAAMVVIVRWKTVWEATEPVFGVGWLVPVVMLLCLLLMAVLLGAWRLILHAFTRGR